ncbi:MAG: hypothetical protein WBQ44_13070 [Rhodococcus sp. (in: high G+C Gram-positive bacteria)]
MKRIAIAGVLIVITLAGCSTDSTENAAPSVEVTTSPQTSSPQTSSPHTTSPQTTSPQTTSSVVIADPTPVPPVASEAAATPEAVVPEVPLNPPPAESTEAPTRPTGEQLYLETCQQFITAIDALAATGVTSRAQASAGIGDRLQTNPSWSTLPADDQQQILRGLDAAENSSC